MFHCCNYISLSLLFSFFTNFPREALREVQYIQNISSLLLGYVRLWNLDWDVEIRFQLREIRNRGGFQLRKANQDFMDFLLYKKDLQNCSREQCFFLLIMYARARPLFLWTVFQILLWVSKKKKRKRKERKSPKTSDAAIFIASLTPQIVQVDSKNLFSLQV